MHPPRPHLKSRAKCQFHFVRLSKPSTHNTLPQSLPLRIPMCRGISLMLHGSICARAVRLGLLCTPQPWPLLIQAHQVQFYISVSKLRNVRDCTISFLARPSRRYDRRTDIDVTWPCGFSPSGRSSSLYSDRAR
jgi:hypothetical protein